MAFKMKGSTFYGKGNQSPQKPVITKDKPKVDPDAPGTPGKPGYEPPVKREDLDDKGKAIWDKKHGGKDKEGAPFIGALVKGAGKVIGGIKKAKGVVDKVKGAVEKGKEVAGKVKDVFSKKKEEQDGVPAEETSAGN